MKKLTRIKLINWHLFTNKTIDIEGNTVIAGENGSGKSTLIDAIHYVLSGGKAKFNTAASGSSDRTVENYMKCRLGVVGKEFFRERSDIVSHIALQFYDDVSQDIFAIGVVLEIIGGNKAIPHFYYLEGAFTDSLFVVQEEKKVRGYDAFCTEAAAEGLKLVAEDGKGGSQIGTAKNIRQVLKQGDDYENLLQKAMGFDPTDDVVDFTKQFLLPKDDVSLDQVRETAKSYQEIANEIRLQKARAEDLKDLTTLVPEYDERLQEQTYLDILAKDAEIQINLDKMERSKAAMDKDQKAIDAAENQKRTLEQSLKDNEKQYSDLSSKQELLAIKDLKAKIQTAATNKENASLKIKRQEGRLNVALDNAAELGLTTELRPAMAKRDEDAFQKTLGRLVDSISRLYNDTASTKASMSLDYRTDSQRLSQLKEDQKTLSNNSKPLPTKVQELIDAIRGAAAKSWHSKPITVTPLCDVVDVADNESDWRAAVEGVLGKRRFDLFVSPYFMKTAMGLFRDLKEGQDYFGAGIVDVEKLAASEKVENSLADKVTSFVFIDGKKCEYSQARQYIDYCLGRIRCVETIDYSIDHPQVTKGGLYFDGKSVRNLLLGDILVPYVGKAAIQLRLDQVNRDVQELEKKTAEQKKTLDDLETKIGKISQLKVDGFVDLPDDWAEEDEIIGATEELEKRLAEIESTCDESILTATEILKKLEEEHQALLGKKRAVEEAGLDASKDQAIQQSVWGEANNANLALQMEREQLAVAAKDVALDQKLLSLANGKTKTDLKGFVEEEKTLASKRLQILNSRITSIITAYGVKYSEDLHADIENRHAFLDQYNKIVNENLVRMEPKAEEEYANTSKAFKESFISKLRGKITGAQDTIKGLKASLARHPFGSEKETFEFVATGTKNADYADIYKIVYETNQDYFINTIFSDELTGADKEVMDRLFTLLTNDPGVEKQQLIDSYCDYRNYLDYDIVITSGNGDEMRYSENKRARSGGETQTPFYALIAGSFDSSLTASIRAGESPCGIVILDEAFNNMDGERIHEMMEFYRELNIQLIISVPTSRYPYIAEEADTNIMLSRHGNYIALVEAHKEKSNGNA